MNWIYCKEKEPDDPGKYLVSIKCGNESYIDICNWDDSIGISEINSNHKVNYNHWYEKTSLGYTFINGIYAWTNLPAPADMKTRS